MKKIKAKTIGIVKGAPSGFVISLLVHAGAFALAGLFVVFTVVNKEEKKFVPPKPVDRPKMKLKKPKVKVKKSSKPKSTTRIVTKVQKASMPEIQLPEMSGIGDGLAGDIGGFEIMPDMKDVTIFGSGQSIGSDFVGTFIDFKRGRNGRPVPMDPDMFRAEMNRFFAKDWKPSSIARYYRSPKKLYATCFMVPPIKSALAPSAFDERETIGYCWAVHYKGQLVYNEDIRFRFWGHGDDLLAVRVNGECVLNGSWPGNTEDAIQSGLGGWASSSADSRRYWMGNNQAVVGDWISLKAGEAKDMEVVIGEVPGGTFCAMLAVEVEGVEYERGPQGGPLLPMFKTAEPSWELIDVLYEDLVEDEVSVTNGPVFRDY